MYIDQYRLTRGILSESSKISTQELEEKKELYINLIRRMKCRLAMASAEYCYDIHVYVQYWIIYNLYKCLH